MVAEECLERPLLNPGGRVDRRSVRKRVGEEIFEPIGRVDVVAAVRVDKVLRFDVRLIVREHDHRGRLADRSEIGLHPRAGPRIGPDLDENEMKTEDVARIEDLVARVIECRRGLRDCRPHHPVVHRDHGCLVDRGSHRFVEADGIRGLVVAWDHEERRAPSVRTLDGEPADIVRFELRP